MSATLTPRRGNRLEIGRASNIRWGGGEFSTEVLEAGQRRVTLAEMTKREREGPSRSRCRHRNRYPLTRAVQLGSRSLRLPPVVA